MTKLQSISAKKISALIVVVFLWGRKYAYKNFQISEKLSLSIHTGLIFLC